MPTSPEYAPHEHITPVYSTKIQYAEKIDDLESIDKTGIHLMQKIVVACLYYVIAIDNAILVVLSDKVAEQSIAVNTIEKVTNY